MKTTWKSHKTKFISFVFLATNYMLSKKKKKNLLGSTFGAIVDSGYTSPKMQSSPKMKSLSEEREREREETNGLLYAKPIGVFQISFLNVYFLI